MTAKHDCLIDGCTNRVVVEWAVCPAHWKVLPHNLRYELARAYSPSMVDDGPSAGLATALARINAWIRETFGADDRHVFCPEDWERLKRMVRERDAARAERRAAAGPNLWSVP